MATSIRSRGFTLIELLVVIAIIGILSAVVLASLNTARQKGSDAAVQADLSSIRTQAEIFYGTNTNSYDTMCTADATVARAIAGADNANGGSASDVVCTDATGTYVVSSPLPTGGYWCVDSTGVSGKRTTASVATDTACPAS